MNTAEDDNGRCIWLTPKPERIYESAVRIVPQYDYDAIICGVRLEEVQLIENDLVNTLESFYMSLSVLESLQKTLKSIPVSLD